jgi:hypothetical protein
VKSINNAVETSLEAFQPNAAMDPVVIVATISVLEDAGTCIELVSTVHSNILKEILVASAEPYARASVKQGVEGDEQKLLESLPGGE